MKKTIIAIIAVALVAALGVGSYFLFTPNKDSGEVTVAIEEFADNPDILISLMTNPARFESIVENDYQLGAEKTAEFYECPEEWLTYSELITVKNTTEDTIAVYGLEITDNGKNGVYISTVLDAEYEIVPDSNASVYFNILCDNGDLTTYEAKALVDSMDIKVVYRDASVSEDAASTDYKTAAVNQITE